MHKIYEDTIELLNCEIEEISKKKELSDADVENLYKIVDIVKDFHEINNMSAGGASYGMSYGVMPYWGQISYDDASFGRGVGGRSGINYASYARGGRGGNSGRNYANNGNGSSSYGRDYDQEEMRMMPNRGMEW